jgi:hypothetical protein
MIELISGNEYLETEIDFLTKLPWRETKLTYLGRHPYDHRHMFASETGGTVLAPDDSALFKRLSTDG